MLETGSLLGGFEILKPIGAGGMSGVFLVRDNLERHWALKVLKSEMASDPGFTSRFRNEALILSKLTHSNIISLHSYFEEGPYHCLVMEYLDGGSLKDLISRVGPVQEERCLAILAQICSALAYAHQKQVIHRDIKPSNVLLGTDDLVKVTDFGIARMLQSGELTRTGTQMGTPIYMSPEQIQDSKHITAASDVYSLGVSFYEMLCGRPPYDDTVSSPFHISEQIVYQPLSDPRDIYAHISTRSIELLQSMTAKDASQRPGCHEILRMLEGERPVEKVRPAQAVNQSRTIVDEAPPILRTQPAQEHEPDSEEQFGNIVRVLAPIVIVAIFLGFVYLIVSNWSPKVEEAPVDEIAPVEEVAATEEPAISLDLSTPQATLRAWNDAHNTKNIKAFWSMYASTVDFYGESLSFTQCAGHKETLLTRDYADFHQRIEDMSRESESAYRVRLRFTKIVTAGGKTKSYPSYLDLMKLDGKWFIHRESDEITDYNLGIDSSL